jgi:hypothetical protein
MWLNKYLTTDTLASALCAYGWHVPGQLLICVHSEFVHLRRGHSWHSSDMLLHQLWLSIVMPRGTTHLDCPCRFCRYTWQLFCQVYLQWLSTSDMTDHGLAKYLVWLCQQALLHLCACQLVQTDVCCWLAPELPVPRQA